MSENPFDKYELYEEENSIYCYSGTGILINKFGITDSLNLKKAEAEITFAGLLELQLNPIQGNYDKNHLYSIHRYLFSSLYDFAGQTRREDISKGNTKFCVWQYIEGQLDKLFLKINGRTAGSDCEEVADFLSYVMAELNIIHPFREGNGRTIREFIREYAANSGYYIDWSKVEKKQLLGAMIESVFDKQNLKKCLIKCMC